MHEVLDSISELKKEKKIVDWGRNDKKQFR
jgi:hypothetical protein